MKPLTGVHEKAFLDRYSVKDKKGNPMEKTPQEMWKRIAKAVAKQEDKKNQKKFEREFYSAMEDFKYVPGGRILAGAGTGYSVTFYNCFVIPSPRDSRGGILETLKQMVEIMAHGGGVGINLSSLRPRGARVKKVNGFSSGPCNWAELFSVATKDIIQQGGSRRGALMLMLWDWHPDIEEFITVKQDLARINGANLSVCVSDKFMEAVEKDADWDLVFPDVSDADYDTKWDGDLEVWKSLGKKVITRKTVKARKIWDLIAEAAWKSAEPGVVFMERYNKLHNNWYWNRINCVNPCVTGDTLVSTKTGQKQAKDLKVGDKILTPKGFKPIQKFYNNGVQRIYEVLFSDGGKLRATADHKLKVIREDGKQEWAKVIDLRKNDRVIKLVFLGTSDYSGKRNKEKRDNKQQYIDRQKQISVERSSVNHSYDFAILANTKLNIQQKIASPVQASIARQSILSTPDSIGGRMANANITWPTPSIISESFLSSDLVNLNLLENEDLRFRTIDRSIADQKFRANTVLVQKVEDTGTSEEVFDVYEPETLTWVTNGYVSLDCGEEGLPPWGVCNLGSINLSALVKGEDIDEPGKFDFDELARIVKIAVRFQDDIVDMDPYVFEGIRETQLEGERRIGLGTMGLGDALIKLHLRYGSDESLELIEKVYKLIRDEAYKESVKLSREKGRFAKFDSVKFSQGKFIKQLPKDIQKDIKKYGIRNSVLLMQAPTGTTALMANTTSGIEPVYEFEFVRKSRLGEDIIRHHLYDEWYRKHKKEVKEKKLSRPAYFVGANDLTPEDHVKVQAAIQKYVDASISKTVNAPRVHAVEDVKKLYTLAYKLGCKGITYMREGSRAGVLERIDDKKTEVAQTNGQKQEVPVHPDVPRPLIVEGVTYAAESPIGKTYVTINHDTNGEPFEVFIVNGKSGSDVAAMADALGRMISFVLRLHSPVPRRERMRKIVSELAGIGGSRSVGYGENRVRSLPDAIAKVLARYAHFKLNGKVKDTNGSSEKNSLDSGNGVKEVVLNGSAKQNETDKEDVVVMQQLAIDAAAPTSLFDICPECGTAALAYQEGCQKCYSCGYSAC